MASKLITRTFTGFNVEVTTINPETKQAETKKVYIPATKESDAIKSVTKQYAGKGIIGNVEKVEELRGMTVECFLANSKPCERPISQQKK